MDEPKRTEKKSTDCEEEVVRDKIESVEDKIGRLERDRSEDNIVVTGLEIKTDNKAELIHEFEHFIGRGTGPEVQIKPQ
ncbi:hypothetical protein JTB14_032326 [Gonioctena quinquepunctata]|nr:hypothetical protein JTB14_032326 [Gonioctena quinquepunctata]